MRPALPFIAALFLAATPAGAQSAGLSGEWSGEGFQVGPNGYQGQWSIRLTFVNRKLAEIEYPDLGCRGELKLVGGDRRQAEYLETITSGPCLDGGRVIVRRVDGRLMWFWYGDADIGVDASAVLYPSDLVS